MNFIIWLIVGGLVGWVASMMMGTNGQQGLLLNVIVGIVGAFVAGWLITPLLGIATINQNNFSLPGLLVSLVGAVILLAVVGLLSGGRMARR
ncbi:MAG: GlsB/YeaQ/YmgE family stress response membrane protein [Anaerolinea sp.]|nr:GlsB/YeaQ/YmgE family stress response membrane protein [Anaerolinea sp.]